MKVLVGGGFHWAIYIFQGQGYFYYLCIYSFIHFTYQPQFPLLPLLLPPTPIYPLPHPLLHFHSERGRPLRGFNHAWYIKLR